jgi:nucleoside-diphosphate-sugar epimerase
VDDHSEQQATRETGARMTTVAVTDTSRPVGRALLERLDGDPGVERVVALDTRAPPMPVAKLDFRPVDLRDRVLDVKLAGVDVIAHLGCGDELDDDVDVRFARTVSATRNLLDAAGRAGVGRVVHRSSAMVYGAHPDNPVPLDEQRPRRANPEYPPAHHHALAEELVEQFDADHPEATVVVLRPVTVLGPGEDHVLVAHLETPRLLTVRDREPPWQFVHSDDLAEALHLAVTSDMAGVYNVAADGWLSLGELCGILGVRRVSVPEAWADAATRWLWRRRLWPLPPGGLPLLTEPWVVRSDKLRAQGWAPERSNREIAREFAAEHHAWARLGPWRVRRRTLRTAAATTALAAATAWYGQRRLRT